MEAASFSIERIASSAASYLKRLHRGAIWMSDDFDEPLPDEFWPGESVGS